MVGSSSSTCLLEAWGGLTPLGGVGSTELLVREELSGDGGLQWEGAVGTLPSRRHPALLRPVSPGQGPRVPGHRVTPPRGCPWQQDGVPAP